MRKCIYCNLFVLLCFLTLSARSISMFREKNKTEFDIIVKLSLEINCDDITVKNEQNEKSGNRKIHMIAATKYK